MAARYPLNLPADLKREAALLARKQGVSLNQFFLWSISEKVSELKCRIDDPNFPNITYRREETSGTPVPVLSGTGIRVQTIVISHYKWKESIKDLADDYGINAEIIEEALRFYQAHKNEVDALIQFEREVERHYDQAQDAS
jgi:uncharacterized protein (DUF433 family)